MFDLNLSTDFNGRDKFEANNSEGLSPETSVENGEGESSSSNDHTCSGRASALNAGNDRVEKDDPNQGSGLVTRELFPVSRLDELNRWGRQNEPVDPPLIHSLHQPRMVVQQELQQVQQVQARKSRRGPRSRSSQYRGVTFYRRTGRWESHIWDCGKQVYLGGFDTALAAARAYDRAAIRFRGVAADINFNLNDYNDMKEMMNLSKEEFVLNLRRQSNGFSRGNSKYRGVAIQKCGRWEARMGQFLGQKAYDKAASLCNGSDAATTFELSKYNGEMPCNNGARETGSQHDLNLNLGMSASPSKDSGYLGSLKLGHDVRDSRTLELHVGNSGTNSMGNPPLVGVPVSSEHPTLCTGVNPNFVPYYEEKAWQMHGHVRVTQNAASGTAASSGFSSLATIAPISCATPAPAGLSSHSNIRANASGCYSWIKPYLPPS